MSAIDRYQDRIARATERLAQLQARDCWHGRSETAKQRTLKSGSNPNAVNASRSSLF